MQRKNESPFPYYVGTHSLEELANKSSRVAIMNILGGESSKVTPVSHEYSGGNVVAGVQYGRSGSVLETKIGNIPVYGSIKEILNQGIEFDTGVIYLPPAAVSHAVSEMCAMNEQIKRIVIVTEKIAVKDARYIRYGAQNRGVDIVGANSLGVANAWEAVRIGGALGGDKPAESLLKGSVAIHSNSGNFSTTLAEYLKTAGFGTSTIVSSGKDVYIHYALPEFLYAAENDPRTKIILVYVEPGGYYEKMALDWIRENRFKFTKPIVAVVTGRWKKHLTRSVGHAGAISGGGDDAEAKENWFDDYFGVPEFNAERPNVSERGVRVATIQDVPLAIAEVMKKIGHGPDFDPVGDLSLKPWFVNDQKHTFTGSLSITPVRAMSPYDEEIQRANKMVGAQYIRESMRNRSGATYMDRSSQLTVLHGMSLLNLVKYPFASTALFAVTKSMPSETQLKVLNPILNFFVHIGTDSIDIAVKGRKNGASPNAYIGAGVMLQGNNPMYQTLSSNMSKLIDAFFVEIGRNIDIRNELISKRLEENIEFVKSANIDKKFDELEKHLYGLIQSVGIENIFTRFAHEYNEKHRGDSERANPYLLLISAALLSMAWDSLTGKQITRKEAEDLPIYMAVYGVIVGSAAVSPETNKYWQAIRDLNDLSVLEKDYTTTLFHVMFGRDPEEQEIFAFNSLMNLTVSNGPGTISAKGAKESVSARNHIPTSFAGFMTNTGFAHGGNGFEAVEFLIKEFQGLDPYKENESGRDAKLESVASRVAQEYIAYKKQAKAAGELDYRKIPCTNHPVFKGKPVNHDPREQYVRDVFKQKGMVNPFLEFYHHLVQKLFDVGATKNVFCVNIDAVIATVSLELFWRQFQNQEIGNADMQDIVFTMFLFGRMVGSAAEIADHKARGTDMDCRTPTSELSFVQ